MINKIYNLKIDSSFDETVKAFEAKLGADEEIVSTSVTETRLIVVTKRKSKNLLTDELRKM